jgi:hypothetical protein
MDWSPAEADDRQGIARPPSPPTQNRISAEDCYPEPEWLFGDAPAEKNIAGFYRDADLYMVAGEK